MGKDRRKTTGCDIDCFEQEEDDKEKVFGYEEENNEEKDNKEVELIFDWPRPMFRGFAVTVLLCITADQVSASPASSSENMFIDLLPWLLALVGLIIIGGVLMFIARRYATRSDNSDAGGFTLQHLRDLHASGELSDEEYESARAAMIGRVRSDTSPEHSAKPADSEESSAADPIDRHNKE